MSAPLRGAEARSLEPTSEVALLCDVTEARQPDVKPLRTEEIQEASDCLRTPNRHNGDALSVKIPALGGRYEELSELSTTNANKLNALICESAIREGMLCADIYTVFNGSSGRDDAHAKGLISEDEVHPSVKGHRAIAAAIAELGYSPLQ